jgi:transcriptional regulator with XRE-family HTH domain
MADKDLQQLRQVLREAVQASHRTVRELEAVLGLAHGNLTRLLDGRLEIKARHIVQLAVLLKVRPGDFFELGCPEANRAAEHRLADWVPEPRPARKPAAAASSSASPSAEELSALVRNAVRQELAALGITSPERPKT